MRRRLVGALAAALLALGLAVAWGFTGRLDQARGSDVPRCERFAAASTQRAATPTGHGPDVLVVGDSWSVGLGLRRPLDAWPSRLPGRVHVSGFSGSGFSALASSCGRDRAFDRRAGRALAVDPQLVVVEGGLNDFDQPDRAVRAGFGRLMAVLHPSTAPWRVVVVGPATAPSRAAQVPRVDRLLRRLCERYDVGYVSTRDLALPYLPDELHPTAAGHRRFGDAVATRIARLGG